MDPVLVLIISSECFQLLNVHIYSMQNNTSLILCRMLKLVQVFCWATADQLQLRGMPKASRAVAKTAKSRSKAEPQKWMITLILPK